MVMFECLPLLDGAVEGARALVEERDLLCP